VAVVTVYNSHLTRSVCPSLP